MTDVNFCQISFPGAQLERVPQVPGYTLRLDNGCQASVLRTAFSLKNCGFRENHEKQVTYSAFANFWHPSCSESNCTPATAKAQGENRKQTKAFSLVTALLLRQRFCLLTSTMALQLAKITVKEFPQIK